MNKLYTLFLTLLFTACSTVKIQSVDKADDFTLSKYTTFDFFDVQTGGNALNENYTANLELLKEALAQNLELRGLKKSADNPDLKINLGVMVEEKIQTRETSFANPGDRVAYMGQRNYSWKSEEVEVGRYREGTVVIHLVENKTSKLVWEGSATSVLPEKSKNTPALIKEAAEKIVAKIN
jgi:hypothetical protein